MTHPPENHPQDRDRGDRPVANFLRQNAPDPPPADPALRSQILMEIHRHPHPVSRSRNLWWLVPPTLAAAALATWLWPRTTVLTAAERTQLEQYLISSWTASTTIETDPLDDWLAEGEPDLFENL